MVAVGIGTVAVPVTHTWAFLRAGLVGGTIGSGDVGQYRIIWDIRLPRVLLAVVVGAGLATVGVAIQAMVRNALAEPFVLGISSGASVGATVVALFGVFASMGIYALSVGAFLAALGATVIVYLVARTREGLTPLRLVLTGTAMSYGFFAVTTVLVFQAPNGEAARSALFWLLGSLAGANWASLPVTAIVVVAGALLLFALSGRLNALAMGDEAAMTLGVSVPRLRVLLLVVCSAMTEALVAVSGAIGFVGLILPHLVRLVVGADHRRVLAVAPLAGAVFLVQRAPDVILINDYGGEVGTVANKENFLRSRPGLRDIPAVKQGRFFALPYAALVEGPRNASAVQSFGAYLVWLPR